MEIITHSEKETINLGKQIAKQLTGQQTIGLVGELGAGKTIFIKGVAQGLGIKKTITSPTFVLMKVYKVRHNKSNITDFVHSDAYRLSSEQELIDIGINDWINKENVITAIEWAGKIKSILPFNTIFVKIIQLLKD